MGLPGLRAWCLALGECSAFCVCISECFVLCVYKWMFCFACIWVSECFAFCMRMSKWIFSNLCVCVCILHLYQPLTCVLKFTCGLGFLCVFRFQAGRRKYCVQFGTMVQVCHVLFLQYNKDEIQIMQCSDLCPNWPVIQADLHADYIVSHLHNCFSCLCLCAVLSYLNT